MQSLPEIAASLRRAADAEILDVRALGDIGPDRFLSAAAELSHAVIDVRGELVRLQFTRDRLGSRDFYHLSIALKPRAQLEPGDLAPIVTAFFPDGKVMAIPSILGNSVQFLGKPFENGTATKSAEHN